jgi:hypothetical protein
MRRCLTAILVVGLVSMNSRDAAAQSQKDVMAAAALGLTPVGALTPIMVSPGTKGEKGFQNVSGRFSHYSPKTGESDNVLGASYYHAAGANAAVSGTVGVYMPGCPAGATCKSVMMLGGDVHSTLWNSTQSAGSTAATSINLQGSLGYGHESDFSYLSLAVGVPLAVSFEQASKARIVAFVRPAFGFGSVSSSLITGDKSGTRPMIGAGAAWISPSGWGIHASYNKIVIQDGGNSLGAGFSWNLGK